jgi:hypothetical protein
MMHPESSPMPQALKKLRIRTDGATSWLLADPLTGQDVGGVHYRHDNEGNHYQPWLLTDGRRADLEQRCPQLGLAAQMVADHL